MGISMGIKKMCTKNYEDIHIFIVVCRKGPGRDISALQELLIAKE